MRQIDEALYLTEGRILIMSRGNDSITYLKY